MKDYVVHGTKTIQYVSVRIILVVDKVNYFCIWVADIKLTNIQSDTLLIRTITITNLAPELELSPEECVKLLKPVYV